MARQREFADDQRQRVKCGAKSVRPFFGKGVAMLLFVERGELPVANGGIDRLGHVKYLMKNGLHVAQFNYGRTVRFLALSALSDYE